MCYFFVDRVFLSCCTMLSHCTLQIDVPDSVTKRFNHSMSTYYISRHYVWLIITGGNKEIDQSTKLGNPITGSNINVVMELGMIINT